jgi:hypothetical protein
MSAGCARASVSAGGCRERVAPAHQGPERKQQQKRHGELGAEIAQPPGDVLPEILSNLLKPVVFGFVRYTNGRYHTPILLETH